MNWLHNLRSKTHEEKRRFALGIAFLITFLIFVMWLLSASVVFSNNKEEEEKVSKVNPFNDLKNILSPIFEAR